MSRTLRCTALVALGVILLASPAAAQSECFRVPYQQTATTSFTIPASGSANVATTITVPSLAFEAEQISVKLRAPSGGFTLMTAHLTTVLHDQPAKHGMTGLMMSALGDFEPSWSQLAKVYADPGSTLTFNTHTISEGAGTGQIEWSISGRLVTAACWFSPQ